jgi:hypothetical protein
MYLGAREEQPERDAPAVPQRLDGAPVPGPPVEPRRLRRGLQQLHRDHTTEHLHVQVDGGAARGQQPHGRAGGAGDRGPASATVPVADHHLVHQQITDLLDPNQKNLQVRKQTPTFLV